MSLKERIGASAPRWLVRVYRRFATVREFARDCRDYNRATLWWYGAGRARCSQDDREPLGSRLVLAYQGIEKGTSFPQPKRPYGMSKIPQIEELLQIASRTGSMDNGSLQGRSAVEAFEHFNSTRENSWEVTPLSNSDGRAYDPHTISAFVRTRHSVRNFDPNASIDLDLIRQIVSDASTTPSVCNHRSYRAHYFDNRALVQEVLELQNGNRGLGHTIAGLFALTVRQSAFVGAGERNQRWIDGGLFAMTLVWLSHAHGLGTCFLNWSETNAETDRLRSVAGVPSTGDVISLIAVGYAAVGHRVARSTRRNAVDTFFLIPCSRLARFVVIHDESPEASVREECS